MRRTVSDELVGPLDEVLHVGRVSVPAVVLPPCELAVKQALIHRRHDSGLVVAGDVEAASTEQALDLMKAVG